jgi:hypothetical protein
MDQDKVDDAAFEAWKAANIRGLYDLSCGVKDAFAAGRAQGRAEGWEESAKLMCPLCNDTFGRGDDDQPVVPHFSDSYQMWVHGDKAWRCDAGPIWNVIEAARITEAGEGNDG